MKLYGVDDLDIRTDVDLEIDSLTTFRRSSSDRVGGTALRTIPVKELMRDMGWVARIAGAEERLPDPLPRELVDRLRGQDSGSNETLLWMARVCVTANAAFQASSQAGRDNFGMVTATASVWVRRARDRGFLPDLSLSSSHMPEPDFGAAKRVLRYG